MASLRDRVERLRARIPRRSAAHASCAEQVQRQARSDLVQSILKRLGQGFEGKVSGLRARLASGQPTAEDDAFLAALPADLLRAAGWTAGGLIVTMAELADRV